MNFLFQDMKGIYFIAEMSANHVGRIENALEIVRAAKQAGANCVKIQTYTADTMTIDCDNQYFRIQGGLWNGYKLFDLYQEAYTPWEWHEDIKNECNKLGMDFLSTPFDRSAVDFLESLNVEFYKIASFELIDIPLIEYTASKGKPLIISCGMGSIQEIQEAVDACHRMGNDQIVLLKCCSQYPAKYGDMNLAVIEDMKKRFGVPVGLSDHSMGEMAAIVAACSGACIIEKHFCLSRTIKSPDSEFSMEPEEFAQMVQSVKASLNAKGEIKYELTKEEESSLVFRRSVFSVEPIAKGEKFTDKNIRIIRPGNGLEPKYYDYLLGKRAAISYPKGYPISRREIGNEER